MNTWKEWKRLAAAMRFLSLEKIAYFEARAIRHVGTTDGAISDLKGALWNCMFVIWGGKV